MQEQLVEQIAKLVAKQINDNQFQKSEEKIPNTCLEFYKKLV